MTQWPSSSIELMRLFRSLPVRDVFCGPGPTRYFAVSRFIVAFSRKATTGAPHNVVRELNPRVRSIRATADRFAVRDRVGVGRGGRVVRVVEAASHPSGRWVDLTTGSWRRGSSTPPRRRRRSRPPRASTSARGGSRDGRGRVRASPGSTGRRVRVRGGDPAIRVPSRRGRAAHDWEGRQGR